MNDEYRPERPWVRSFMIAFVVSAVVLLLFRLVLGSPRGINESWYLYPVDVYGLISSWLLAVLMVGLGAALVVDGLARHSRRPPPRSTSLAAGIGLVIGVFGVILLGKNAYFTVAELPSAGWPAGPLWSRFCHDDGAEKVNNVGFSSDGQHVLARSEKGSMDSWDVRTGTRQAYAGPALPPSSGGSAKATGSVASARSRAQFGDHFNRTITLQTGDQQWKLEMAGEITSARFSPSGRWFACGDSENTVCVWDTGTGQLVSQLQGPFERGGPMAHICALAFSADEGYLFADSLDHHVRGWELPHGKLVRTITMPDYHQGMGMALSPQGDRLAVVGRHRLHVWDVNTGQKLVDVVDKDGTGEPVCWSPDGLHLLTVGHSRVVLWFVPR